MSPVQRPIGRPAAPQPVGFPSNVREVNLGPKSLLSNDFATSVPTEENKNYPAKYRQTRGALAHIPCLTMIPNIHINIPNYSYPASAGWNMDLHQIDPNMAVNPSLARRMLLQRK